MGGCKRKTGKKGKEEGKIHGLAEWERGEEMGRGRKRVNRMNAGKDTRFAGR